MCGITVELISGDAVAAKALLRRRSARSLRRRGPDAWAERCISGSHFQLTLAGAVLHLRGRDVVEQPIFDASGNALLWNGEIFGGAVAVDAIESDTRKLLEALGEAPSVPALMRRLHGPWAFAYWHAASRTLWHGRDALGRRSLLRAEHASAAGEPSWCSLRLSSVSATDDAEWSELPADGIGSVQILEDGGWESRWHASPPLPPPLPLAAELASGGAAASDSAGMDAAWEAAATREGQAAAARLLVVLSEAVRRRVCAVPPPPAATPSQAARANGEAGGEDDGEDDGAGLPATGGTSSARVAVLFSGGIDCMVLARLADLHLPPEQPIDLINVAFGDLAAEAPDRQTGLAGVAELRGLSRRTFHFIEVDVSLAELQAARRHLLALLRPAATVMDLNIGAAMWFGARGCGRLRTTEAPEAALREVPSRGATAAVACRYAGTAEGDPRASPSGAALNTRIELLGGGASVRLALQAAHASEGGEGGEGARRASTSSSAAYYRSGARVLLLGSGADEQLGGYGRHKTVFRKEGWAGLASELRAERERLWLRNLGRDDRVISDWSKEARHPYLDEEVMACLADTPMHLICDLRQPLGQGDKLVLRRLARLLGLRQATGLQKRAIQFGTRIANKNVCGQAVLDDSIDLREVVHPDAERAAGSAMRGDAALRESLSKKRGEWASARAARPLEPSVHP